MIEKKPWINFKPIYYMRLINFERILCAQNGQWWKVYEPIKIHLTINSSAYHEFNEIPKEYGNKLRSLFPLHLNFIHFGFNRRTNSRYVVIVNRCNYWEWVAVAAIIPVQTLHKFSVSGVKTLNRSLNSNVRLFWQTFSLFRKLHAKKWNVI